MSKKKPFSHKVRLRAVRMVCSHPGASTSLWAVISSIAPKIGCSPQTLHKWVDRYSEDYVDQDRPLVDKKKNELSEDLKDLKLTDASFTLVHQWIFSASRKRWEDLVARRVMPTESVEVQIDECGKLARAASVVARRLGRVGRVSTTISKLADKYRELGTQGDKAPAEKWVVFVERVSRDAALLANLAESSSQTLQSKKRKTGAPKKIERDVLFYQWFALLKTHTKARVKDIYEPAFKSWNRYFKSDKIMGDVSAEAARKRGRSVLRMSGKMG
jgi:transposase-like protein